MFSGFNEEQFRLLAFGSQKLTFPRGTRIFQDGQSTDGGYVVIKGEIDLLQNKHGKDHVAGKFRAGDIIGEMAILTKNQRVGTAVVAEDCELMKISRATMHRILGEYPELAVGLQKKISENISSLSKNLAAVEKKMRKIDLS